MVFSAYILWFDFRLILGARTYKLLELERQRKQ